ncbi:glycosyltransferase [Horticoccus luteus]|uniref:Glycosyltransferase n=1 Tax=Horticoccus luteus TaxID=2862869 RepID=A0A8F9TVD0_9BACT|nr:glycosyltransferase family 2 protein [Horticoccus luteus]QYM79770.1 glycosyltransferase [Horticoccus luteus]
MPALPRVSIITPSLNQEAFLRACIDSVLAQDYPAIDFFVADGGSSDGSIDVLKSYGSRVSWRSERDGGQAQAINAGLQRTMGEIVCYVNSDDLLRPGAVRGAASALLAHPDVDVVYGDTAIIDEQGRFLRKYPTEDFDGGRLIEHCFISQPAAFWRRSLHERCGYFDPRFDHTLDYEFWIRALRCGAKFLHVPEEWAAAREHAGAKSQRLRGEIFRQIRDLQLRHLGYCDRNWWEQYLRYLRDERGGVWRGLPGARERRLWRLAWWPWRLWRSRKRPRAEASFAHRSTRQV